MKDYCRVLPFIFLVTGVVLPSIFFGLLVSNVLSGTDSWYIANIITDDDLVLQTAIYRSNFDHFPVVVQNQLDDTLSEYAGCIIKKIDRFGSYQEVTYDAYPDVLISENHFRVKQVFITKHNTSYTVDQSVRCLVGKTWRPDAIDKRSASLISEIELIDDSFLWTYVVNPGYPSTRIAWASLVYSIGIICLFAVFLAKYASS